MLQQTSRSSSPKRLRVAIIYCALLPVVAKLLSKLQSLLMLMWMLMLQV
jgi:hypothetical protein